MRVADLIPGLGRCPGEGHGNLLQYSYLENPMNRGVWRATVRGVAESQIWLKQLSMHACMVALFLVSLGSSLLFSIVVEPIYVPTSSVGVFTFLPILSSIYFFYKGSLFDVKKSQPFRELQLTSLVSINWKKNTKWQNFNWALQVQWTEEPGVLQSIGLQRVRHDLATEQQQQVLYALKTKTKNTGMSPSSIGLNS